ncbi:MAG TPA: RNA 2',3'-cyclic phosphodiesterase [Clostridia bacterium]|nr:RNA 2',3'-cyclic phosphodiesterase [Clostridia bacterium]
MNAIRAFIGIDFEDDCKRYISVLQQSLRKYAVRGRWKHSDNFHLTLKFLDEIDAKQQKEIEEALRDICLRQEPFLLEVSELGMFKGGDSIRVLWLGLTGDIMPLQSLAADIERSLLPIGFPAERRPYTPHITIGQDIVFERPFEQVRASVGNISFGPMKTEKLTLLKSEQIQNKRVYTKVSEFGLK